MPGVEAFSSLPILQVFVGGITLVVTVYMMLQAQRDKRVVDQAKPVPDGQTMMLEGLASLRELVHGIRNLCTILNAIDGQHRRLQDMLNDQTHTHADIMRPIQSTLDAILNELRMRDRR